MCVLVLAFGVRALLRPRALGVFPVASAHIDHPRRPRLCQLPVNADFEDRLAVAWRRKPNPKLGRVELHLDSPNHGCTDLVVLPF